MDINFIFRALNNRGHAKYMQVEFDEALKDYNEALELDSNLIVAKYNRGTILYRMGKFDQAMEDLKRATEADKDNSEYQEALEKCQKELKWRINWGVFYHWCVIICAFLKDTVPTYLIF